MAKFARIDNGFVVETITASTMPQFHPSLIWVACPDVVVEGYAYDGNAFTAPDDTLTISETKDQKLSELAAYRNQKYEDGFTYNGDDFQINSEAQTNMIAIMVQFTLGNANPHGGRWFDVDNVPIDMTDTEVQAFIQAAFAYIVAVKNRYWAHDAAIKALNAKQDIIDYDIETGWP